MEQGTHDVTIASHPPARARVVDMVAHSLLKKWFPSTTPIDVEQWFYIARQDADCIVTALVENKLLHIKEDSCKPSH